MRRAGGVLSTGWGLGGTVAFQGPCVNVSWSMGLGWAGVTAEQVLGMCIVPLTVGLIALGPLMSVSAWELPSSFRNQETGTHICSVICCS